MINPIATPDILNAISKNTMVEHLGIEFIEIGSDFLKARMPVDRRTHQPMGILHGGASLALAETLGSVAAYISVDQEKYICVGLEINANHIKRVKSGWVTGMATPIHIGRSTQVWKIDIENEKQDLICTSRITLAVIPKTEK